MANNVNGMWRRIKQNIDRYQRHIVGVFPDADSLDPINDAFCYTIGNSLVGKPELLLVGGFDEEAASVLDEVSDAMASGLIDGPVDLGAEFKPYVLPADELVKDKYTLLASDFLEAPYNVSQVIVSDRQGRFPWDSGCAEPYCSVNVYRRVKGLSRHLH